MSVYEKRIKVLSLIKGKRLTNKIRVLLFFFSKLRMFHGIYNWGNSV